jgi:hypothetical protein
VNVDQLLRVADPRTNQCDGVAGYAERLGRSRREVSDSLFLPPQARRLGPRAPPCSFRPRPGSSPDDGPITPTNAPDPDPSKAHHRLTKTLKRGQAGSGDQCQLEAQGGHPELHHPAHLVEALVGRAAHGAAAHQVVVDQLVQLLSTVTVKILRYLVVEDCGLVINPGRGRGTGPRRRGTGLSRVYEIADEARGRAKAWTDFAASLNHRTNLHGN